MSAILQLTGPVMDLVYKVRALPGRGEEAVVTGFSMTPGGGFNAMAAARAAGAQVRLGGSLGTGPLATIVGERLAALGIETARLPRAGRDQGCCTVLVEPDGERTFVGAPGAEGEIAGEDLDAIAMDDVGWVLLSGYTLGYAGARDAVVAWIARLPRAVALVFDPAPLVAGLPRAALDPVLARADWISANAAEAATLTGTTDPRAAAMALAEGREGAVLRRGAEGCLLATEGRLHALPAHPVRPVDTNGAGDCHIGSFMAVLARGGAPLDAARYATIAAALSTMREGPATPPAREAVLALAQPQEPAGTATCAPQQGDTVR